MYTIPDTWMWQYGKSHYKDWEGRFLSLETDKETMMRTNTLPGTLAVYSFIIVLRGRFTALYSGREITIERDHLFIYTPGFPISIKAVSEDYAGLCLVADESFTVERTLKMRSGGMRKGCPQPMSTIPGALHPVCFLEITPSVPDWS